MSTKTYPLVIESIGTEVYQVIMSRGHHEAHAFVSKVREAGYDWPLGRPQHFWFKVSPDSDPTVVCRYVAVEEGTNEAIPVTVALEALGDDVYVPPESELAKTCCGKCKSGSESASCSSDQPRTEHKHDSSAPAAQTITLRLPQLEGNIFTGDFRQQLARRLAELQGDGALTEAQCAYCMQCDLAAWRELTAGFSVGTSSVEPDGAAHLPDIGATITEQKVDAKWSTWRKATGVDPTKFDGLDPHTHVQLRFRNGLSTETTKPAQWDWKHSSSEDDIVEYRELQEGPGNVGPVATTTGDKKCCSVL